MDTRGLIVSAHIEIEVMEREGVRDLRDRQLVHVVLERLPGGWDAQLSSWLEGLADAWTTASMIIVTQYQRCDDQPIREDYVDGRAAGVLWPIGVSSPSESAREDLASYVRAIARLLRPDGVVTSRTGPSPLENGYERTHLRCPLHRVVNAMGVAAS